MKELLRTTDIVLLTYITSLLEDASISPFIADSHMSSIEGSIGAFPRRVLVPEEDWPASVHIMEEAGLGEYLPPASRRT
jgi:hypothetical protein